MTVRRMRIACWIPKATNTHTHSEYVMLIAFPVQLCLQERVSTLRYTYIGKVKVKCTLVEALRLCTGRTAHRESRGIALSFHDHGTRRG